MFRLFKKDKRRIAIGSKIFYVDPPVMDWIDELRREKEAKKPILIDSEITYVDSSVADYIDVLSRERNELLVMNNRLSHELDKITPVVESKDYKPALSKDCGTCKYVVKSTHDGNILGCCKDNVCDDYSPKEV